MTTANVIAGRDLETLRAAITGEAFAPGEDGYDEARRAWNLTTDQRPAVVVVAESAADVVQAGGARPGRSASRCLGAGQRRNLIHAQRRMRWRVAGLVCEQ
jgi:hypothetical protein